MSAANGVDPLVARAASVPRPMPYVARECVDHSPPPQSLILSVNHTFRLLTLEMEPSFDSVPPVAVAFAVGCL